MRATRFEQADFQEIVPTGSARSLAKALLLIRPDWNEHDILEGIWYARDKGTPQEIAITAFNMALHQPPLQGLATLSMHHSLWPETSPMHSKPSNADEAA